MRALAVLVVILHHVDKGLMPSGYLGVDIFFVISGYVITASIAARPTASFGDYISGFYVRRIKRLYPALLFAVLSGCFLVALFNPVPREALVTGLTSLVGLANLFLYRISRDYFGDITIRNAFTHTWSLGVEEQFYVLFPPFLWLLGVHSKDDSRRRVLIAAIVALSALSVGSFLWTSGISPTSAFYLMPFRFWELGLGALVYLLARDGRVREFRAAGLVAGVTAIGLLAILLAPTKSAPTWTIVAVMASAVLLSTLRSNALLASIFTSSPAVYLGKLSYSLYLWHWILLSIAYFTVGDAPTWSALILLLMFTCSMASYHFVEKPLRYASWARTRWREIAVGCSVIVVAGSLVAGLAQGGSRILYQGAEPGILPDRELLRPYYVEPDDSGWMGAECVLQSNADVGKAINPLRCTLGDFAAASRRIFVAGDSYSASFVQGFDDLVLKDGIAITITSSWAAAPGPGITAANSSRWDEASEYYWGSVVPDLLQSARPGDYLFLVSDLSRFIQDDVPTYPSASKAYESLATAYESLHSHASRAGVSLVVLNALPFPRRTGCTPEIVRSWFSRLNTKCWPSSRGMMIGTRSGLDSQLQRLRDRGIIHVVDIFDSFCQGEQCGYMTDDGILLYRDSTHPSNEAVRMVSRSLSVQLLELETKRMRVLTGE